MKEPGPDHPIAIVPAPGRVRVLLNGHVVADTRAALSLAEANYPPVLYIPRADADMSLFARTERATHCPYKGDAAYYTITAGGKIAADAVWSYETPFPAMKAITGYLAFYPNRVDAIEQTAA